MKLSILLLLASCSSYQGKTYVYTTRVKVLGVKCSQDYFFNYELGKCTYLSSAASSQAMPSNAEGITRVYTPSGVSVDYVRSYQASPERRIALNKPVKLVRIIKTKAVGGIVLKDQCRLLLNKGEL